MTTSNNYPLMYLYALLDLLQFNWQWVLEPIYEELKNVFFYQDLLFIRYCIT